jgi:hypothetical protein
VVQPGLLLASQISPRGIRSIKSNVTVFTEREVETVFASRVSFHHNRAASQQTDHYPQ